MSAVRRIDGMNLHSHLRIKVNNFCVSLVSSYIKPGNGHLLIEVLTYKARPQVAVMAGFERLQFEPWVMRSDGDEKQIPYRVFSEDAAKMWIEEIWQTGYMR